MSLMHLYGTTVRNSQGPIKGRRLLQEISLNPGEITTGYKDDVGCYKMLVEG